MVRIPPIRPPKNPDPSTQEGRAWIEARDSFFLAAGKFLTMFGPVEASIFALLGSLTNLPKPIALALLADLRIVGAMDAVKRVLKARQEMLGRNDIEVRIEKVLGAVISQMTVINKVRNHIIHHGLMGSDFEDPVASNWPRARSQENLTEISVSPIELEQMLQDIGTCMIVMAFIGAFTTPGLIAPDALTMAEKRLVQHPWQYKPPAQEGAPDKSRSKTRKQPRPPQSSEA